MDILEQSIVVFITQLIFIGCRTWNVKAIAREHMGQTLVSGGIVHLSWLISISIGAISAHEIMTNFDWRYIPVVICSLSGGLIGTYISMRSKKVG